MKESRRDFLKHAGGCALGMVTLATEMQHLGMMSALAQKVDGKRATAAIDYKALVLIFWNGGNDGNNTIVPLHNDSFMTNYAAYSSARYNLTLPQDKLLPISIPKLGGLTYGLHPSLGAVPGEANNGIYELWAQKKIAIVGNCGTLVRPTNKAQFQTASHPKPYQLFSHSDQVAQNQTSISNTQSITGWGGRVSDKLSAASNPSGLVPMVTSIAGAQIFTAGQQTLPLAINDSNVPLASVLNPAGFGNLGGSARKTGFDLLRSVDLDSEFIAAASHVSDLAMQANAALQSPGDTTVAFPNSSIGRQLRQVARLIKKRGELNVSRQIFFCEIRGFDTHTNQINSQDDLLTQFGQAVRSFYDEMGEQGVQNNVTTFTMSDFGRTFNPAGAGTSSVGSDHAWSNHMFVIGGAVKGGDIYGVNTDSNGTPYPQMVLGGPDDADIGANPRGRWLPTTSVDQYAATLARWFGLSDTDQQFVFPNIGNFSTSDLGFMPKPDRTQ